jgi:hypothetical protein
MATISYDDAGVTNVIFFDATLAENHTGAVDITRHAVEAGADVADHIRDVAAPLTLEVIITNTPIQSVGRLQGQLVPVVLQTDPKVVNELARAGNLGERWDPQLYTGWVSPFRPPLSPRPFIEPNVVLPGQRAVRLVRLQGQVFSFPVPADRLADLWAAFRGLQTDKRLLTVSTRLQDYSDMVLKSVTAPVEARDAIRFSLTFEPFRFVEALTFSGVSRIVAPKKTTTTATSAEDVQDQGPQAGYEDETRKQSLVDSGAKFFAGMATP